MKYTRIIITGASSGLGEGFARALAKEGHEVVLVARRRERLEAVAAEMRTINAQLQVQTRVCDLSDPAARAELVAELTALPEKPCMLINNAGLGDYGSFADADPQKLHRLMQVNMIALVELTRALVPSMLRVGAGAVVNIASLAADVLLPDFALYAASKSFVASFSEALRIELMGTGVRVLAVCPGPVHTEFGSVARRAGYDSGDIPLKPLLYTPVQVVVKGSLRALAAGKARYYPSIKIKLAGCLLRMLPLWLVRFILRTRPRRVKKEGGTA